MSPAGSAHERTEADTKQQAQTNENRRQMQKRQTRTRIIETALKLFAQNGFARTSTLAVAKESEVSHGTIFAHFKTQDELIIAVIGEFGDRINKRLHELAGGRSRLREVLKSHLDGLAEFEDFYIRLVTEIRLLPVEVRNTFTMIQSTVSFHISQAYEREEGHLKKLPVHMVFNGWMGLIHYYLGNNDLFSPGQSVLGRYGEELAEYYINLISRD
ncbi:fatty acid metabolism regulator protein [Ruminiclostridium hungatei]|uniref:Fatty acid metabolism regulator protein n=1 Tax=Ruminiclostridium hungatei TaxID=48256 RepID=A0A1V4SRG3_RUMHU|nr:TetR/AcrR family transcriptional regulator [Ruminiclostridium hungatei]OPX46035.1 fatty acid metabolism regulator protein [Ruminiclostridium hungatei]